MIQGKIWCAMLLLFYFTSIYLAVLTCVIRYFEITKMNRLWLTKIFLYCSYEAFISLNSVKNWTCQWCWLRWDKPSLSCDWLWRQLNYFCSSLTGKHCVANSLISIVYQHHRLISNADAMAQILQIGDFFMQLAVKVHSDNYFASGWITT